MKKMKESVIRGVNVKVTRSRIREEERDPALFYYEIRHADDNQDNPCQIQQRVTVNFYGTIVAEKEILLDPMPDWYYNGKLYNLPPEIDLSDKEAKKWVRTRHYMPLTEGSH